MGERNEKGDKKKERKKMEKRKKWEKIAIFLDSKSKKGGAFFIGSSILFLSSSSSPRYKTLGSIKVIGAEFKILNDTSKNN